LEFNNIVESSRRADVEKALILVRCPHNAVATVTLAFARGAPGAACRRRRPRFRRSARGSSWHGLRKPRCRRGGGRATPGDRSMCPSHWATWRHALRAHARQKSGHPGALDCGLRGRYGAAARGRGDPTRRCPPSVKPWASCLPKEGVRKILRLGCQNGGVLGSGTAQRLGGWERRRAANCRLRGR
jgi:hypothetical protein